MTIESQTRIREMRIAVSYRCNLKCEHCYVPADRRVAQKGVSEGEELSAAEIEAFLDLLVDRFGTERISITGGEPLLRGVWPRTRRVIQHALRHGMHVRLITSGSGQVDIGEVALAAGSSPNLTLQISLDGISEVNVDRFRGRRGAMRRALDTVRRAVGHGIPVRVRYTITEHNWDEAVPCYDLVAGMGVTAFAVKPAFPAGMARHRGHSPVDPQQVRLLQLALADRSVGRRTTLLLPQPCFVDHGDLPVGANVEIMYCHCGSQVAYLSANGDIYPCTYLVGAPGAEAFRLGNIRDPHFDLHGLWSDSRTYAEFRRAERRGNCPTQNILCQYSVADTGAYSSRGSGASGAREVNSRRVHD